MKYKVAFIALIAYGLTMTGYYLAEKRRHAHTQTDLRRAYAQSTTCAESKAMLLDDTIASEQLLVACRNRLAFQQELLDTIIEALEKVKKK